MHNNIYLSSRQQQYVDALVPYAIRNKLNVGFDRLSKQVDTRLRYIITGEVKRRIAPATQGVDISFFAKYPTTTINIGQFDLELDKIGEIVLKQELKRYNQKYTVGVQEALTDHDRYNQTYKKDLRDNIGEAFQLNSVSYNDLDFGENASLKPNFMVKVPAFSSSGLNVISFYDDKVDVVIPTQTPLKIGALLSIKLPRSAFTDNKEVTLNATLHALSITEKSRENVATCKLRKTQSDMTVEAFKRAILKFNFHHPMAMAQELPRTEHQIMRDMIAANSPWLTIFCTKASGNIKPQSAILTDTNRPLHEAVLTRKLLSDPNVFKRVAKELMLTSECYIFAICFENSNQYQYIATLSELVKSGQLSNFMAIGRQRKRIAVFQCRQSLISKNILRNVARNHGVGNGTKVLLAQLYACLFIREVTGDLEHLSSEQFENTALLPTRFAVDNDHSLSMGMLTVDDINNAKESRYAFEKEIIIKSGMFSRIKGVSKEISLKSVLVTLSEPLPAKLIGQELTLSSPGIGLPWTKFNVAYCSQDNLTIKLETPNKRNVKPLESLIQNNSDYFLERNITLQREERYRCLWDIGVRMIPYIAVLCRGNHTDKLYQAFKKSSGSDYLAFSEGTSNFSLYGLMADKNTDTARSGMLASLLSGPSMTRSIAEWKAADSQSYVQMRDIDYKQPKMKNTLATLVNNASFTYTQLVSMRVSTNDQPLLDERYSALTRLDVKEAQLLRKRFKDVSHIVYIASLSSLHKAFMAVKEHMSSAAS